MYVSDDQDLLRSLSASIRSFTPSGILRKRLLSATWVSDGHERVLFRLWHRHKHVFFSIRNVAAPLTWTTSKMLTDLYQLRAVCLRGNRHFTIYDWRSKVRVDALLLMICDSWSTIYSFTVHIIRSTVRDSRHTLNGSGFTNHVRFDVYDSEFTLSVCSLYWSLRRMVYLCRSFLDGFRDEYSFQFKTFGLRFMVQVCRFVYIFGVRITGYSTGWLRQIHASFVVYGLYCRHFRLKY